ncbi:hypothetical protein M5K25_010858 [Dendrobium thyrsiflorum]|uniref:Uncharacterized protein n=1 Tax=Dendrobium thyrsiflorum TaxID=117978 RepID=A0ABD0V2D4_DENTH
MEVTNSLLLLSFLGLISLLKLSLPILHWLYATFLRPAKDLKRAYGAWAVVTGATDGIGGAIAVELARRGMHLVLVGRSPAKLKKASDIILAKFHDTHVKTVVWDLALGGDCGGAERLRQTIAGVEVGVLINSAGVTYPGAAYFHEAEERVWREVVRVNVEGMSHVIQVVLPEMVSRRRGAVVNIGSASSVAVPSFPFYAVYAATKAYINQFSRSLYVEYKRMGIDVQCQIPFYVATKMVSIEQPSTFIPSPDKFAKASVRCIGYEQLCTPYWSHAIQWGFATLLPHFLLDAWRRRLGIRKRIQPIKTSL